jgi:hypothetical protein
MRPNYAALSDPERNWQFRRRWVDPPKRKRPAARLREPRPVVQNNATAKLTRHEPDTEARRRSNATVIAGECSLLPRDYVSVAP